jgi:3-oxoacyl-[acyl-carrier-protein] synthase II
MQLESSERDTAGPAAKASNAAQRVAIVAAGVVSPLGFGLAETAEALRKARDCVRPVTQFDVASCRCQTAGQIDDARLTSATASRGRPERLHRAARMMILALREALAYAPQFAPELTVVGTTSGGMTFGEAYYRALARRKRPNAESGTPNVERPLPLATLIANYPPQKAIADAQAACGIEAPTQVIANACASGTNAIGHAFDCIRSGKYHRVLAGGYDALSELVFVGFDSLQAATPDRCRPFDRNRNGMVLGEGAAVFALENLESAQSRGAEILGEVTGYGISTDNHHLTQPNPNGEGPARAMRMALERARVDVGEVGYINAHGTATPFNDAAEGAAIARMFGSRVPVSSTKSMMGHSLGAAGAIEAVISLLALREELLPPNINFESADLPLDIVANEARPAKPKIVLSNSFGFGGTNASLILRAA